MPDAERPSSEIRKGPIGEDQDSEYAYNPDQPEKKEKLTSLEKKIEELRDLEGILNTLDLDSSFPAPEPDMVVDEKGNFVFEPVKPLAEKMSDLIRKGRAGELKGEDKKIRITRAIDARTIKERDLDARIINIYVDLANFKKRLLLAKSDQEVKELVQTLVNKYKGRDWPD